jgi:hypothetical protein
MGYIFKQEAYVPSVVDSIKVMAIALNKYIEMYCGAIKWDNCHLSKMGFEGQRLQSFYRNMSLEPDEPPLIDENGDGIGKYSVFQLGPDGTYSEVGRWTGDEFFLDVKNIREGLQVC